MKPGFGGMKGAGAGAIEETEPDTAGVSSEPMKTTILFLIATAAVVSPASARTSFWHHHPIAPDAPFIVVASRYIAPEEAEPAPAVSPVVERVSPLSVFAPAIPLSEIRRAVAGS